VSSTEVRARLAAGQSCTALVDQRVLSLIFARGLYGARPAPVDPSLLVVGDGRVARALSTALAERGRPPVRWWRGMGGKPPSAKPRARPWRAITPPRCWSRTTAWPSSTARGDYSAAASLR